MERHTPGRTQAPAEAHTCTRHQCRNTGQDTPDATTRATHATGPQPCTLWPTTDKTRHPPAEGRASPHVHTRLACPCPCKVRQAPRIFPVPAADTHHQSPRGVCVWHTSPSCLRGHGFQTPFCNGRRTWTGTACRRSSQTWHSQQAACRQRCAVHCSANQASQSHRTAITQD